MAEAAAMKARRQAGKPESVTRERGVMGVGADRYRPVTGTGCNTECQHVLANPC